MLFQFLTSRRILAVSISSVATSLYGCLCIVFYWTHCLVQNSKECHLSRYPRWTDSLTIPLSRSLCLRKDGDGERINKITWLISHFDPAAPCWARVGVSRQSWCIIRIISLLIISSARCRSFRGGSVKSKCHSIQISFFFRIYLHVWAWGQHGSSQGALACPS